MVGRAHHSRGRRYSQTSSFYLKRTYEKARTFEVACSKWFFLPYAALSLSRIEEDVPLGVEDKSAEDFIFYQLLNCDFIIFSPKHDIR